jgi:hypothetical protein
MESPLFALIILAVLIWGELKGGGKKCKGRSGT